MAENYKHLYEQTIKMLAQYQDELIPGFRKQIEELEAKSKWIPVTERLPEDTLPRFSEVKQIKVLTALISDKGVRTVRSQMRYRDTWATGQVRWRWKYSGSEITHWMPLPEPPKEVE